MAKKAKKVKQKPTATRQPIVAILGHVDHGKTTLLDHIRKTHVQAGEAGGITQSIGAYQAEFQGKKITFIDTPGHAAFSKMRSRGASIADLAVLVVAADDGVKPQTIESIKHLQEAKIPFIVAINKIDSQGSSPETAKAQLTEQEVFVEGYGGNTPVVEISAKEGKNIDDLLENILILSELEELKSEPATDLEAIIIEVLKDQKVGILVNAIVKKGTISTQTTLATPSSQLKVRALFNEFNKPIKEAKPGEPFQVLGFKSLPVVGETIAPLTSTTPAQSTPAPTGSLSFPPEPIVNKLNVIIKADTLGSLEAIKGSISEDVNVILASTGNISESDVDLASTTGSLLVGFNVKVTNSIKNLAEIEEVTLRTYKIIYELLEQLEKRVLRLLEPTIDEEVLGVANILKLFPINDRVIAGCQVESGTLTVGDKIHLKRNDEIIKDARIKFLKSGKSDLKKVTAGSECGILLSPSLDIKENDSIISYNKNKEEL